MLDDLVVLAPGAIPDAPVRWSALDATHVRGEYVVGHVRVAAVLTFDEQHDLVDVVSDDRYRASDDGSSFTPTRWSTPVTAYRDVDGRRVLARGEGRWHPPHPGQPFTYVEMDVLDVRYDGGDLDVLPRVRRPRPRRTGGGTTV